MAESLAARPYDQLATTGYRQIGIQSADSGPPVYSPDPWSPSRDLVQMISGVPGVQSVYGLAVAGASWYWIVMDTDDQEDRYRVYEAESELRRQYPVPSFEFRVLLLPRIGCSPEHIIPEDARIVFPR